ALAGPELAHHLERLLVARGEVVEDGVAEEVLARPLPRNILAGLPDVAAEFQLEVHALAVRRPGHVRAGAADVEGVGAVEDRPPVPDLRNARLGPAQLGDSGKGLLQVLFEAQEVAHLRRLRDRREQGHVGDRKHRLPRRPRERLGGTVQGVLAALDDREDARRRKLHYCAPPIGERPPLRAPMRSEEHTSELPAMTNIVCRLLPVKKKTPKSTAPTT